MASAPARVRAGKGAARAKPAPPPAKRTAKKAAGKRAPKKKAPPKAPPKPTTRKRATKKAARKRPARKRAKAPNGQGKSPKNQANFLATVKQAHPGITSDALVVLFNLDPADVLRRRHFVHEYIRDFSEKNAALRMGYPEETAQSTGKVLLYHAYSQLRVTEILEKAEADAIVSSAQIVAGLWREANAPDVPFSSNAATRIQALKELAKIKKLTGPVAGGTTPANNGHGGVMVVPITLNPDQWEEHATKSQRALKEAVVVDV